jgi:hypothetical protein
MFCTSCSIVVWKEIQKPLKTKKLVLWKLSAEKTAENVWLRLLIEKISRIENFTEIFSHYKSPVFYFVIPNQFYGFKLLNFLNL